MGRSLAIVGAGPTASSLLERLVANLRAEAPGFALRIHLVDPHEPGIGRVWRPDLHEGLWMNSLARDVTLFTDDSVQVEGPIEPGPALDAWAVGAGGDGLLDALDPRLRAEIEALGPDSFPTRRVQSAYLAWFHARVLGSLPPEVEVVHHRSRAVDLLDGPEGHQLLTLADGSVVAADAVVLALGHLDADPEPDVAALQEAAAGLGLVHVPPAHTADSDLSAIAPGADVLVSGMGQASTDLVVLLTEGRGGRFVGHGSDLRYEPSGAEPRLVLGSRRGVPYRSKLPNRLRVPLPRGPQVLDRDRVGALLAGAPLDFRRDVLPGVLREAAWAHHHELFLGHADRTTMPWEAFVAQWADASEADAAALEAATIPDPADRFDLLGTDRPLRGRSFGGADEAHRWIADHVAADVSHRTAPDDTADVGGFYGMLTAFFVIATLSAKGAFSPRSQVEDVDQWWFGAFLFQTSGPPPARLHQLLALADAEIVRFGGADLSVSVDASSPAFVGRSSSHPDELRTSALIDARIPGPTVARTADPLLAALRDRGDVVEDVRHDGDWTATTGKVLIAGDDLRIVRADGSAHPRRHALGVFTSRPAAGAFARPSTNAPAFRQNDAVARSLLATLGAR